jgi:hypothetical protein
MEQKGTGKNGRVNSMGAGRMGVSKRVLVFGLMFCLVGLPPFMDQNAKPETYENEPGKGFISAFSDNSTGNILNFAAAGEVTLYVNVPKNTTVTNATMNLTGLEYTNNGLISDTSSQDFASGALNKLIIDDDSIRTPKADIKGAIWCPFGVDAVLYGSEGFLSDYSSGVNLGIPTVEDMNFTCGDWRGNDGSDTEHPLLVTTNATIVASGEKVNEDYYGTRVYTFYQNRTLSLDTSFQFPTTDYGKIEFISLDSGGSNGMLGGAYYPSSTTANSLLYWKDNDNISLIWNEDDDITMFDGNWLRDDSILYVVGSDVNGELYIYKYFSQNETLEEILDGYMVGYPKISIRPQEDYGIIIGTAKGQYPPSSESMIYKYDLSSNEITLIDENNYNWTDIDWNKDGTEALVCGENGALYLYDNSTSEFSSIETNTSSDLKGIDWDCDNLYAIIVGEDGTVLKFDDSISMCLSLFMPNGSFVSSITEINSIVSVIPSWDFDGKGDLADVSVSNDGGATWFYAENDSEIDFPEKGDELLYVINISAIDTSESPVFYAINLNYTVEGDYSVDPYLDIGDDTTIDWDYDGSFEITETVDDFSWILNQYISNHGANENGFVSIPFVYYSDSQGAIEISDLWINYSTPEFVITDLSFSELYREIGQSVTITATIWNNGDIDANSVLVQFYDDSELLDTVTDNILKNDFQYFELNWIPQTDGFHNLSISVDPTNSFNAINRDRSRFLEYYFVPSLKLTTFEIQSEVTTEFTNTSIYAEEFIINIGGTFIGNDVSICIGENTVLYNDASLEMVDSSGFVSNIIECGNGADVNFNGLTYVGGDTIYVDCSIISLSNISHIEISDEISIDNGGSTDIDNTLSVSFGYALVADGSSLEIDNSDYVWLGGLESSGSSIINIENTNYLKTNNIISDGGGQINLVNSIQVESENITSTNNGLIYINDAYLTSTGMIANTGGNVTLDNTVWFLQDDINGNQEQLHIIDSVIHMASESGSISINSNNGGELSIVNTTMSAGNDCDYAINLETGTTALIEDCTIDGLDTLHVRTGDIQIRNVKIKNADSSAIEFNGVVAIIENITIENSTENDIILESGSNLTTWDSEFNNSKILVYDTSTITKKWDLLVQVLDEFEEPVEDAEVKVYDNNSILVYNYTTDSTGYVSEQMLCSEYEKTSSSTSAPNPYRIEASKESISGFGTTTTSMTRFQDIPLQIWYTNDANITCQWEGVILPITDARSNENPIFKYVSARTDNYVGTSLHYMYDEGPLGLIEQWDETWTFNIQIFDKDDNCVAGGGEPPSGRMIFNDVTSPKSRESNSGAFISVGFNFHAFDVVPNKNTPVSFKVVVTATWGAVYATWPHLGLDPIGKTKYSHINYMVMGGITETYLGVITNTRSSTFVIINGGTDEDHPKYYANVPPRTEFQFKTQIAWDEEGAMTQDWFRFDVVCREAHTKENTHYSGTEFKDEKEDFGLYISPLNALRGTDIITWKFDTLNSGTWMYEFHLRGRYYAKTIWPFSDTSTWQYQPYGDWMLVRDSDTFGYNNDVYIQLQLFSPP